MAKLFQPTLVIGIGGTGKGIILALKKMIAENSPKGMADYPLLKFLSVDTDVALPTVTSSIQTIKESELSLNKSKETFSLHADFNTIPDLKSFPDIAAWFPPSLKHYLTPAELEQGAGQRKPIGRFSFAWNADLLKPRLEQLLRNPVDVDVAKQWGIGEANLVKTTNVFICGSLCGGTGSGTFLDMAYLVRNVASHIAGRSIYIYGMFAMSSIFDGMQGDANIKPNCYASLVEMDHFMNPYTYSNPYRQFYPAYKNIGPKQWDYSKSAENGPFDFPFLFDKTNAAGFSLSSSKAFSEMVARFIYLLTGHEVAEVWQSMDNNVRKLLDVTYNKELLHKPNNYRSMGTFSVMFPRRMAIQMCAYKLADVYFETILDSSYNAQEIKNITERFMNESKFNPTTSLMEELFDKFTNEDSIVEAFEQYVDEQKENLLNDCEEEDKKEYYQKIVEWKQAMDGKVEEFARQNAGTPRDMREKFLNAFTDRIAVLVDLTKRKDEANKVNNEPKQVRGSLDRALQFTTDLLNTFTDAAEKYNKRKSSCARDLKDLDDSYKAALDDLESACGSLLGGKKAKEAVENAANACVDYFNKKRESIIADQMYEFFYGITEGGSTIKYKGVITELEAEKLLLTGGKKDFREVSEEVKKYLQENKNYEANYLCDILFDYKEDVEGVYNKLIAQDGEDYIFEKLSKELKDDEDKFGNAYQNIGAMTQSQILIALLRSTEEFFKDMINKIDITEKLLKNEDKLNLLLNGNYYNNASIYLGLDGGELSKVNLNLDSSRFFAITIPDIYEACPCRSITGVQSSGRKCPVDEDPDNYKGEKACPHYPNCLKKRILDNAPTNLAIVPTTENAEVNIVTTIAGFPLHAVSSAMYDCKPPYMQQKEKYDAERKAAGINEEVLHMFGPIEYVDLAEKSVNPMELMKPFKKQIMLALALGRLSVDKLSVDFVTKRDLDAGRRENPSLHLGEAFDDIFKKFQSTKTEDQSAIKQVSEEMNMVVDFVKSGDENTKNSFAEKLKSSYEEFNKNLPQGVKGEDIDIIDELSQELCGIKLSTKSSSNVMW